MPDPDSPFYAAAPLPPAYDLTTTLKMLGLNSRQAFRQARLDTVLKPLTGVEARITLFDAHEVQAWAKRLARLRILQAWGEHNARAPLLEAPTDSARDTVCPRCGAFALHRFDRSQVRCIQNHVTASSPARRTNP